MERNYYSKELGIDGDADTLARQAEQYTDGFSDEALEYIHKILIVEGKEEKAQRVAFVIESRNDKKNGAIDLGQMKLDILDKQYTLYEEKQGDWDVEIVNDMGRVATSVHTVDDDGTERVNAESVPKDEFFNRTAEEHQKVIDSLCFYAQPAD